MGTQPCGSCQSSLQADCASLFLSRVREIGRLGVPGAPVPAPVGRVSRCEAAAASGEAQLGGAQVGSLPFLSGQPSPTPGLTPCLPTHVVLFNPIDPTGMWVGWGGVEDVHHGSGEGIPGGPDHTLATLLLTDFLGKSCAGGTPMSTASAGCR